MISLLPVIIIVMLIQIIAVLLLYRVISTFRY